MSDISTPSAMPKRASFITVNSTNQFNTQAVFEDHIRSSLNQAKEYHEFVYTDVPDPWGEVVPEIIDERISTQTTFSTRTHTVRIKAMPTWIHSCLEPWISQQVRVWLIDGHITRAESEILHQGTNTTIEFKHGPYRGSRKEPDFFFQVNNHIMPTLTVESGWAETISDLHDDMNLMLVGGEGAIKIVLLVKWTRIQGNFVSGTIELFARDRDGMPRLRQSEVIFPRPPNATAITQRLGIRRRDIFGPALLPGRNGNDTLHLEIEALRSHATRALGFMNLNPA